MAAKTIRSCFQYGLSQEKILFKSAAVTLGRLAFSSSVKNPFRIPFPPGGISFPPVTDIAC